MNRRDFCKGAACVPVAMAVPPVFADPDPLVTALDFDRIRIPIVRAPFEFDVNDHMVDAMRYFFEPRSITWVHFSDGKLHYEPIGINEFYLGPLGE